MSSSVQVVIRLRPLNEREKKHGTLPVISASTNEKTVTVIKGTGTKQNRSSFSFDNVFTAFSTQEEVFDATLKPIIKDVMRGFESTVFAYGQTGTGKTHTMEGNLANVDDYGVIPRSASAIFQEVQKPEYQSHNVTCSYLEIYNEDLCDLLNDSKKQSKLDIMEGKNGPFCRGLSEKQVTCAADVLALMQRAQHQRKVGETNMNKQSSRSHCIFTLKVDAKRVIPDGSIFECKGKLHMVDLAGSECAKTANLDKGGSDQAARERERMNINRSLLTLGRVVSMLKEQSTHKKKSGSIRIPYRDSKLTRILQESLGGRCKTCIVATLSPSVTAIEESVSTLNYAQAANGIINKPVTTSYMSNSSSVPGFVGEKSAMAETGGSVEQWQEMECRLEYMQGQVDEAKAALARKHLQQQELVEQAEKMEEKAAKMEQQYFEAARETESFKEKLAEEVEQRETVEQNLRQTELTLKKTTAILQATQKTEVSLTAEAEALLDALQKSVSDGDQMYLRLQENHTADVARKDAAKQFNSAANALLEGVLASLNKLSAQEEEYHARMTQMVAKNAEEQAIFADNAVETIRKNVQACLTSISSINKCIHDDCGFLPVMLGASASIGSHLENASRNISIGEQSLNKKWDSCNNSLEACAEKLNNLESAHAEASRTTLTDLDQNISTTKLKISDLAATVTKAIEEAKDERTKVREAVKAILEEWKTATSQSSQNIHDSSKTQCDAVSKTLEMLDSEMVHLDTIDSRLLDQKSLLESGGVTHCNQLKSQGELLVSQKNSFNASHEMRKNQYESFVKNVLTGVGELVKKQMAEVIKNDQENFSSIVAINNDLIEQNIGISSSAKDIVQSIQNSNETLEKEVQIVRNNENEVATVLRDTSKVLSQIKDSSGDQQTSINEFASSVFDGMQSMGELDSSVKQIGNTIRSNAENVTTHLTETVLHDASTGVSKVMESGKQTASFCRNEVISDMISSIEDMEKPRNEIMAKYDQACENIRREVHNVTACVGTTASALTNLTEGLRDEVSDGQNTFIENVADDHKLLIVEQKDALSESVENHINTASFELSASTNKASATKEKIGKFSKDTIKIDEETESLVAKSRIKFSKKLTSTPSESTIIQSLGKENVKETVVQNDENMCDNENGDVNISIESEASDISTKSQQSVLQLRSPNCENTMPKPRKKKSKISKKIGSTAVMKRSVPKGGTPLRSTKKRMKR